MKIVKYIKLKNGKYKVRLSNLEDIILYDDVIIKHKLITKKDIDDELLYIIKKDNEFYTYYNMAFKYILKRLRSKKEIINYLENLNLDNKTIEEIVNKLILNNMINDKVFANAYLNDKINLTNWGMGKIKRMLLNYGIDEDIINSLENNNDENRIKRIIEKQIKINKKYSGYILKQRIINHLISLGYEKEKISDYLNSIDLTLSEDLYEKEYNKLKKKLEYKYSDEELDKKIKYELKKKGFIKISE